MTARRVLVVACSATKRDPGWSVCDARTNERRRASLPLVELYDGPAWRMVRARYAAGGLLTDDTQVWALSAKFGLVPSYTHADTYDERIQTSEDAVALAGKIADDDLRFFGASWITAGRAPVTLFGGRLYGYAFASIADRLKDRGYDIPWSRFEGRGIGDQLGGLRRYLEGET